MSREPIPCKKCQGGLKITNSGKLLMDDITGLLVRQVYVRCTACGCRGQGLVTVDIEMYSEVVLLPVADASLPEKDAA